MSVRPAGGRGWAGALALFMALPAAALEFRGGDLQLHGFAAQGWTLSSGNNVNGESADNYGSLDFHELGINGSWRPMGSLLFSAQAASVRHGDAVKEDLVLEYAVMDYMALQGERGRSGFRVGKIKNPIGFYNDARDNVFTRPGVLAPNSIYLETNGARAFGYFSLIGGGAYWDLFHDDHALYLELVGAGSQRLGDNAEIAILRSRTSGRFDLDRGVLMRIANDYQGGRAKAALSLLTSRLRFSPGAPPDAFDTPGEFKFDQAVLSLQYNTEKLSLTTELVARRIELDDISTLPFIGPVKQDPAGYYLQGTYRMTPKWQAFVRYDEQIRDWNDRSGNEQSGAAVIGRPRHYYFARDWTVGTRYDLVPNRLAVWGEFHYVDGVGWLNPLDNPSAFPSPGGGTADRYWNFLTVMLGYRF
jgi:hypothetical protein